MPRFWPGRRVESVDDYSGVVVSLEDAHLHSHSYRSGRTEFEEAPSGEISDDEDGTKAQDHEGTGMLEMNAAEYSIEGLRKEVRRGGKGRKFSDYECMFLPLREWRGLDLKLNFLSQ
jgi:hypothetical protein